MFAIVISLVVVGAAVAFATRVVLIQTTEPDKPATPRSRRVRGNAEAAAGSPALVTASSWSNDPLVPSLHRRIRSALLLIVIVTVLGALTALLLVIGGAILLTGVRNAVQ